MKKFLLVIPLITLYVWFFPALAKAATLNFNPSTLNLNVGDSGTISIMIDTEGQETAGAEVHIDVSGNSIFVPSGGISLATGQDDLLDIQSISSGSNIDFVVFSLGLSGSKTLVNIQYNAISTGTTTFTFHRGSTRNTVVADEDSASDLLPPSFSGTETFNVGEVVTPTPTPTATPTPTPTVTPTPTPTV